MTRAGDILLSVKDISLRFGGVRALTDVSFDIHEGEIFAIIGPNGAGKSSMLNCINGFYHPQEGTITFKGAERRQMRPHEAAAQGISRTFQNIALFKGMTTLENVMTGRMLKMRASWAEQAFYVFRGRQEEIAHREKVEEVIDFLEIQSIRKTPVGTPALRPAETRGTGARARRGAGTAPAGRADGRHECRGKGGHVPLRALHQP